MTNAELYRRSIGATRVYLSYEELISLSEDATEALFTPSKNISRAFKASYVGDLRAMGRSIAYFLDSALPLHIAGEWMQDAASEGAEA